MRTICAILILTLCGGAALAAQPTATPNRATSQTTTTAKAAPVAPLSENQKIEALLSKVEHSGLIFTRNGQEYPATKAAEHLRGKWEYAGKRIKTARQFIDKLASGSSVSGKPYYIKKPDGTKVTSRQWLTDALNELERREAAGRGKPASGS